MFPRTKSFLPTIIVPVKEVNSSGSEVTPAKRIPPNNAPAIFVFLSSKSTYFESLIIGQPVEVAGRIDDPAGLAGGAAGEADIRDVAHRQGEKFLVVFGQVAFGGDRKFLQGIEIVIPVGEVRQRAAVERRTGAAVADMFGQQTVLQIADFFPRAQGGIRLQIEIRFH